jgi:hypothetical protein
MAGWNRLTFAQRRRSLCDRESTERSRRTIRRLGHTARRRPWLSPIGIVASGAASPRSRPRLSLGPGAVGEVTGQWRVRIDPWGFSGRKSVSPSSDRFGHLGGWGRVGWSIGACSCCVSDRHRARLPCVPPRIGPRWLAPLATPKPGATNAVLPQPYSRGQQLWFCRSVAICSRRLDRDWRAREDETGHSYVIVCVVQFSSGALEPTEGRLRSRSRVD